MMLPAAALHIYMRGLMFHAVDANGPGHLEIWGQNSCNEVGGRPLWLDVLPYIRLVDIDVLANTLLVVPSSYNTRHNYLWQVHVHASRMIPLTHQGKYLDTCEASSKLALRTFNQL